MVTIALSLLLFFSLCEAKHLRGAATNENIRNLHSSNKFFLPDTSTIEDLVSSAVIDDVILTGKGRTSTGKLFSTSSTFSFKSGKGIKGIKGLSKLGISGIKGGSKFSKIVIAEEVIADAISDDAIIDEGPDAIDGPGDVIDIVVEQGDVVNIDVVEPDIIEPLETPVVVDDTFAASGGEVALGLGMSGLLLATLGLGVLKFKRGMKEPDDEISFVSENSVAETPALAHGNDLE